jgi:hypothetical protein
MRRILLAILALPVLAAADRADRVPAATPAGEARSCIPINQIRESRVRSDRVIDFVMRGRKPQAYRVTLDQPCPSLGFEQRFAYGTSLSRLCAQDIITVLFQSPGLTRGASCGLAPFQPVTLTRGGR